MTQEEMQLWEDLAMSRNGSRAIIRDQLIQYHMKFVRFNAAWIARRFFCSSYDLESVGAMALAERINSFDVTRGHQFLSFARLRIEGAMIDEARRIDHVSRNFRRSGAKINKAISHFVAVNGVMPSDMELAAATGLTLTMIANSRSAHALGYAESIQGWTAPAFVTRRIAPNPAAQALNGDFWNTVRKGLNSTEKMIVNLMYLAGMNQKEAARAIGLSESRVSQLHDLLLRRLKSTPLIRALKEVS